MKKLRIMLQDELLTDRSGTVARGRKKQFPISCSAKTSVVLVTCLLFLALGATHLTAADLVPGVPARAGVDFVWIHDGAGWHMIPVNIAGTEGKADKADKIQTAINNAGFAASVNAAGNVDIAGAPPPGVDKWEFSSHTGELNQAGLANMPPPPPPAAAVQLSIGFDGSLSGIGFAGNEASYSAGIGYNSVSAFTTITYASLSDQTLNGLLTLTYDNLLAALPTADQDLLSLDLADGLINFTVPSGATGVYVESESFDTTTGSIVGGLAEVPEPSTMALMVLAFGFGAVRQLRKKMQAG